MRAALEALAARLAAERITEDELAELAELLERMRAAARRGDAHDQSQANAVLPRHDRARRPQRDARAPVALLEPFSRTYLTVSQPGIDLCACPSATSRPRRAARARRRGRRRGHARAPDGRRRAARPRRTPRETHRRPLDAGPRGHADLPARAAAGAAACYESHERVRRADRRRRARRRLAHRALPGRARTTTSAPTATRASTSSPTPAGRRRSRSSAASRDGVLLDFTDRRDGPRHQRGRGRGRARAHRLRGQGARHRPHPHRRGRLQHRGALPAPTTAG